MIEILTVTPKFPRKEDSIQSETFTEEESPQVVMALARVEDQTLGDSLRLARQQTKKEIDKKIAERLNSFLKNVANRD